VKGDGDKLAVMGIIAVTEALISLGLLPFVPLPSPESWPFLGGAVTLHAGTLGAPGGSASPTAAGPR